MAALAAKLGVSHQILLWSGAKPKTGVQERAREARYRLLVQHARAIGAGAIATAHHADDQAETVLFRLIRGSGVAGLAGMEAMSERDGVTIARPLLGVTKSKLVAFCRSRGAAFADDPSNADPRFARPRLRALIERLGEEGLTAEGLVRLARRAAEADQALGRMTAAAEARLGADGPTDARALFAEPIAIIQRILARRIAKAGGRDESRIGLEKIETLATRLGDATANGRAFAANVGGALIRTQRQGRVDVRFGAAEESAVKSSVGHSRFCPCCQRIWRATPALIRPGLARRARPRQSCPDLISRKAHALHSHP